MMTTGPANRRRRLLAALFGAVWLAATGCAGERSADPGRFEGAPIILISIDTLRADHLPAYGYGAVKTPNIDALAAESILFENAYSHVPLTLPAHVAILTGQLPPANGVRNNIGYRYDAIKNPAITAALKTAGYESGAAVSAYVLRGVTGLSGAFDFYEDAIGSESGVALGQLQRPGSATLEVAKRWIGEREGRPFFFMLHVFEPHSPYAPTEPFRSAYASNPYDGEIAVSDELVGRFVAFLKEKGIYDRAVIILLSDHGEGLGDHGEDEHGVFLYREAVHVPLIVRLPGAMRGGERVKELVQLIDVAPTIASVTGVRPATPFAGHSLLDTSVGERPTSVYSETLYPRLHLGWSELRALTDARYQYIEAPTPELYDLVADPKQKTNVLADERRVYAAMKRELEAYGKEIIAPVNISPEEAQKLAALGYIGSTQGTGDDLPDPKEHIGEFEQIKHATRLTTEGRVGEALEIYEAVVAKNPRFADAWSLLATNYEKMGRNAEAVDAYKQALKSSDVVMYEVALSLGGLLLRMNRFDEAEEHAKLALESNSAGAHSLLARVALARGDFAVAEREATEAMSDPTMKARSSVILAQAYAKAGKTDEALRLLDSTRDEARRQGVRVELLDYARGDILATVGRNSEAETAFLAEIAGYPSNLSAYSSLAVLYLVDGKPERVDRVLEQMFAANPNRQACTVAAETLATLGNERGAAAWRKRASAMK
ncbi:MAG: sulfatase-like hydrolase/transferase [Acidobacteria bacterium]|nr:sulfatase-like hydrolase/transferase [Acidobacteriota bacterium]